MSDKNRFKISSKTLMNTEQAIVTYKISMFRTVQRIKTTLGLCELEHVTKINRKSTYWLLASQKS